MDRQFVAARSARGLAVLIWLVGSIGCSWTETGPRNMDDHRGVADTYTITQGDLIDEATEYEIGETYTFSFPNDTDVEFVVTRVEDDDGVITVEGETSTGSQVSFTYNDSAMFGSMWGGELTLEFISDGAGGVTIYEVSPSRVPIDLDVPPDSDDPVLDFSGPTSRLPQVDLLFVFPDRWIDGAFAPHCSGDDPTGSRDAWTTHAIRTLNYIMTGHATVQLAGHACIGRKVSCRSSAMDQGCLEDELRWANGQLEISGSQLGSLRESTYADLVVMVIPNSYFAGVAETLPEAPYVGVDYSLHATLIVNHVFAFSTHTLAHELGHAFGLRHDRRFYGTCDAGGVGIDECNFGGVVVDDADATRGYTIMATDLVCECPSTIHECKGRRYRAFSGSRFRDNAQTTDTDESLWELGQSKCDLNAGRQTYGFEEGISAISYIRNRADYVSKFRTRPADNGAP